MDITGAAEPFVKYSYLIKDAAELPRIFKEAFHLAGTGRKGPVLIDVPVDVQNTLIDFTYPETVKMRTYKPTVKGNPMQIKSCARLLRALKDPLSAQAEEFSLQVRSMSLQPLPKRHRYLRFQQ